MSSAASESAAADLARRIARTIRQDVSSMHAYAIQPSAGLIKLDAMENPFRLPAHLRRELGERLADVAINRYPGAGGAELIDELAAFAHLPSGCSLGSVRPFKQTSILSGNMSAIA